MPLGVDELHIAKHALLNHLLDSDVILAITPLQADLEDLFWVLRGIHRPHLVYFFFGEDETLFAENVLTRLERIFEHRIVQVHGR